jgi:hypothetical protein
LLEQKKYNESFAALQLASHYGAEDADLSKKIDLARKQLTNNSTVTLSNLKLSVAVIIISVLLWYFVEFKQAKNFIYWLFNIYFGDLW